MKKTKLLFGLLFSVILVSCGDNVKLQDNFVAVESVQVLTDSTYRVNFKCTSNGKTVGTAFFDTPYRYSAGDTMWSQAQLKKHYNDLAIALSAENQRMKDSAFFCRVSLGNKIDDLNAQIKDLKNQNGALQNALVKLK
jgi:hypothetical protein